MRNPMVGRVTSEFSPSRRHPVTGVVTQHWGIDLGAPTGISPQAYVGADIRAAYAGVVERSGWGAVPHRSGNGVLIRNPDGERQYYGHLSRIDVSAGQQVSEGQVIGGMGATGNVTGPHLHFECHNRGSTASNGFSRVRDPRQDFRAAGITPGRDNPPPASSTPSTPSGGTSMTTPRAVWRGFTGQDYVNDGSTTKDHQLARAHQYTHWLRNNLVSAIWNRKNRQTDMSFGAHVRRGDLSRAVFTSRVTGNKISVATAALNAQEKATEARDEIRQVGAAVEAMADQLDDLKPGLKEAVAKAITDSIADIEAADVAQHLEVTVKADDDEEEED